MKEVRRPNRLCGRVFFFFLFILAASGGDVLSQFPPEEIRASITVTPDTLSIGDRLTLTLEVRHSRSEEVRVESVSPASGDFELVEKGEITTAMEGDTALDSLTFTLTTYDTGQFALGPVNVALVRNGTPDTLLVQAGEIFVQSLLEPDAKDLRDIKGMMPVPGRFRFLWIAIGSFLILAIAVLLLIRRRRRSRASRPAGLVEPLPPADVWARGELAKIERMELPARGKVKEHYVLVSEVLRRYIFLRHGVETLERTTGELLSDLTTTGIAPLHREAYARILEEADLVKFAKWKPEPAVSAGIIPRVREAVDRTSILEAEEVVHAVR
jgi:hypothetical protein